VVDLLAQVHRGVHPCWPWSTAVQGGVQKIKYFKCLRYSKFVISFGIQGSTITPVQNTSGSSVGGWFGLIL
jgi:hypothetical protein